MANLDKAPGPGSRFDWRHWVHRFDRMQERYLPRRAERFAVIARIIGATRRNVGRILDLGCGAGSLTEFLLDAFPESRAVGVDVDAAILLLARPRLERFGPRAELLHRDLRDTSWAEGLGAEFDAVVSATALHWLSSASLVQLYRRLPGVLAPGGVFLNADHIGSDSPAIQEAWRQETANPALREGAPPSDTWSEFFEGYAAAVGANRGTVGEKAVGKWEGVEDGMPLAWQFDRLRECGFVSVDCFWRFGKDAVYGGLAGGAH